MNTNMTTEGAETGRAADGWLMKLLAAKGLLSEEAGRGVGAGPHGFHSEELLRRRLIGRQELGEAVAGQYGIRFAEPQQGAVDKLGVSLVPERLCLQHNLVPLNVTGDSIELLMANPIDDAALEAVAAASGRRAVAVYGFPDRIDLLIAEGYGADAALYDLLRKLPDEAPVRWVGRTDAGGRAAEAAALAPGKTGRSVLPVARLVNYLIAQAVRLGASDVHIEHDEKNSTVRYRVDGDLRTVLRLPRSIGEAPLVSRIKVMAELDIAERRRPQDGRAKLLVGEQEIGLRVSTIPTSFGEKVVLRLLDARSAKVPLETLGFRPVLRERLEALARLEQGMVLLTGPTGSGKTTTLYALLNRVKDDSINIVTVEDPVEYRLEGVNQVQVNEKADLDFACVLRSVLRQDPDVVLVGEIRDRETADIAFQAALTGHLVFSTLHTNDAVASVARLLDMGVERFKLAPALMGAAAQRLVRRVCTACRKTDPASPLWAARMKAAGLPASQSRGTGCERCNYTGFKGRVALTELLDLRDPKARERVGQSTPGLREDALRAGWLFTFSEDALWHLSQGEISAEDAAAYLDAEGPAAPAAPAEEARPKRVLIVDDNPDNRAVIEASLLPGGYEVRQAEDGRTALEEIARHRPDLVLLDLMMPEMDGLAVLRRVRGEMGLPDLPVVIVTAMSESESQEQALAIGADDYLTKPFIPGVLRARVKALFRRTEA